MTTIIYVLERLGINAPLPGWVWIASSVFFLFAAQHLALRQIRKERDTLRALHERLSELTAQQCQMSEFILRAGKLRDDDFVEQLINPSEVLSEWYRDVQGWVSSTIPQYEGIYRGDAGLSGQRLEGGSSEDNWDRNIELLRHRMQALERIIEILAGDKGNVLQSISRLAPQ